MQRINNNQIGHVSQFNHPSWRRVISQLRDIFNELHNQVESKRDDEKLKLENLSLSDICLEANEKYIKAIENETKFLGETSVEEASIKDSFRIILKVWKLCQIIFIKSSPSGSLLIDLQEWYRSTNNIDPLVQELFSECAQNIDTIYQHRNYWLLVLLSVLQGRIDTSRHLLSFHPQKGASVFKEIDDLLRSMPNFTSLSHLSLFEFKAKWEYWQKKCIQVLTNENFSSDPTGSLELICRILCGDESVFHELKEIFSNWYYMLISYLSYSNPTFNISDLHMHLSSRTCIKVFESEFEFFDKIIYNVFDFDVESIIKDSVELFSNNLFSAHLMDILFLNGKLQLNKQELSNMAGLSLNEPNSPDTSSILHEQHLIAYAEQLLASFQANPHLSMYQIGFDYLLKCRIENKGIELIEDYIEKIRLDNLSELEANKLFHLTYEFNLHDLAFEIGRNLQIRALKRGLLGTALGWNIKIKDPGFGTLLAEKIIEKYFSNDDLNLLELTENLNKEIIYCDRLIFLSKFREFLKLTKYSTKPSSDAKQAASILVQLLEANNLVPVKYRKRLIMDVLPLIKQNALNEEQIFSVMRSIQNFENRVEYFGEELSNLSKLKLEGKLSQAEKEYFAFFQNEKQACFEEIDAGDWKELIGTLSQKLADAFALKSIEILCQ